MTEEWRAVPGFEGAYEVSSLGRVRSLDRLDARGHRVKGRLLRPGPHHGGYKTVSFFDEAGRHPTLVHIAVAAAFIGPRPDGAEVLHGDGDAANARAGNLRYGTRSENEADKEAHGTRLKGETHPCVKIDEKAVHVIRRLAGQVPQKVLAEQFGVTFSNISAIQLRKSWAHV